MIGRRTLLGSAAAITLARAALAQPAAARVLRFVPQAPLTVLDPGYTTANVTRAHAVLVYDTLFAVDSTFRPCPQMAEGHTVSEDSRLWTIRLREGLRFHDGSPVRASDCAASMRRWASVDTLGQVAATAIEAWEPADDRTLLVRLKRPFPFLLEAMASPTGMLPVIMPTRLAAIAPGRQTAELVGSGPFRFAADEFNSGSRAVYQRFDGYVPRQEAPDWNSGGKQVHFDRLEWLGISDAGTAAGALRAGEVDWWEQAMADLLPQLRRNRDIVIDRADPTGYVAILRFNSLHPPFDKPMMRRAVMMAVNQNDYMGLVTGGDSNAYQVCHSLFPCGTPYGTSPSADPMREDGNLDLAKALIRQAGYAGERVVIINPTDFPSIAPMGQVTYDLLQRLGLNVELVETDWGSVLQRRNNRGPVEQGGWSIYHTWNSGGSVVDPVRNNTLRGQGERGMAGWYSSPRMEALVQSWLDAGDLAERTRLAAEVQALAFEDAPTIPIGQFYIQTAYRRSLTGIRPSPTPVPWGVRKA
ncbi:ABC transporter substrate-binding protein [Pararoseomonas indoligenes]|uniref:ABC transporter substrate-binding protein n=1 Tax=Roseomonas indoligenes TaxID=2820811 RepID=A0A940MPS7_9PROT|nr:ABC transporter substrate-binding protein [Pararoseomonas indoligenes]MBP0491254.1 ABC transporter substrate-binding protein [Pararoseomonas indoligenes]